MRALIFLIPMLLIASCADWQASQSVKSAAICDGTKLDRAEHAKALVSDGGAQSKATGVRLLGKLDKGCGAVE